MGAVENKVGICIYCHNFTKKCDAKHIILIDVLVEMEMILNISRIWL